LGLILKIKRCIGSNKPGGNRTGWLNEYTMKIAIHFYQDFILIDQRRHPNARHYYCKTIGQTDNN